MSVLIIYYNLFAQFGLILLRSVPNKYAIVWSYQVLVLYLVNDDWMEILLQYMTEYS